MWGRDLELLCFARASPRGGHEEPVHSAKSAPKEKSLVVKKMCGIATGKNIWCSMLLLTSIMYGLNEVLTVHAVCFVFCKYRCVALPPIDSSAASRAKAARLTGQNNVEIQVSL